MKTQRPKRVSLFPFMDDYDRMVRNSSIVDKYRAALPIRLGLATAAVVGSELIDRARPEGESRSKVSKALLAYAGLQVATVAGEGIHSLILHRENGQLEAATQQRATPAEAVASSLPPARSPEA